MDVLSYDRAFDSLLDLPGISSLQIIEMLLEAGATPDVSSLPLPEPEPEIDPSTGFSRLGAMRVPRYFDEFELDRFSFVDSGHARGKLLLWSAVEVGSPQVVRYAFKHGVQYDLHEALDRTLLTTAVLSGQQEIVELLLAAGNRQALSRHQRKDLFDRVPSAAVLIMSN